MWFLIFSQWRDIFCSPSFPKIFNCIFNMFNMFWHISLHSSKFALIWYNLYPNNKWFGVNILLVSLSHSWLKGLAIKGLCFFLSQPIDPLKEKFHFLHCLLVIYSVSIIYLIHLYLLSLPPWFTFFLQLYSLTTTKNGLDTFNWFSKNIFFQILPIILIY